MERFVSPIHSKRASTDMKDASNCHIGHDGTDNGSVNGDKLVDDTARRGTVHSNEIEHLASPTFSNGTSADIMDGSTSSHTGCNTTDDGFADADGLLEDAGNGGTDDGNYIDHLASIGGSNCAPSHTMDGSTSSCIRHDGTDNGLVDVNGLGDTVAKTGSDDGIELVTHASNSGSNGASAGMMDGSPTSCKECNGTDDGLIDVDGLGDDASK